MPSDPLILRGRQGLILVEAAVVDTARRFLRPPEGRLEAGGILLGVYRGDHLDVVDGTAPLPGDRRTPVRFDRRDAGHGLTARAAWRRSDRVITCVGEWHTHTAGSASPSGLDLRTWRRILAQRGGRPHLFLIASPRELRFYEGRGEALREIDPMDGDEQGPTASAILSLDTNGG